ncbi:MAG: ABC transporter substrate-binding protein [Treponema sp.]|jgi:peptide/nickel transport system substrate-binding protein|nr:ABC transporter substrate-binding protein [Treponema sp.]
MSEAHTEITVVHSKDQARRSMASAPADMGARTPAINGEPGQKLGLTMKKTSEYGRKPTAFTRNGCIKETCEAAVLPGESEILPGAYPLECAETEVFEFSRTSKVTFSTYVGPTRRILKKLFLLPLIVALAFSACSKESELSPEDLASLELRGINEIIEKTVSKPWNGEDFAPGKTGGTWKGVISQDPKSFNLLIAEQDNVTGAVTSYMIDYLVDYDNLTREWEPRAASFEIRTNEAEDTLDVIYTLRDDLYWTWYESDRKIKVTSDDIIFWYNEIRGDPRFQSSGYYQQFLEMADGSESHVDVEKIDDLRFVFHFPRIVAEPLLATNMNVMPRYGYEDAKKQNGVQGVMDIYGVNTDPKLIPSCGKYYLAEYTAGQRLVYKRNPTYWEKDAVGVSLPYPEEEVLRIIPDENTEYLLFREGEIESYVSRPEDLDELASNQQRDEYTVYNNEGSQNANFWTFNQNPKNKDKPFYDWFTKTEFRQAMSRLLNRERIINQVFRGLAMPKLHFFPETNRYYDENIRLRYEYDPDRAVQLLSSIGMTRDASGVMRDSQGRAVEFNLAIQSDSTVYSDIASIIADELGRVGIKANIRVIDFQKLVEQLFTTWDWESLLMLLSGSNTFPSQGSNVWASSGNFHMWYPQQESPATDWEARIDYLYNEGAYTVDPIKAKVFWDEYQRIILEQCPLIYLARVRGFFALNNRWDQRNVYYDNKSGLQLTHVFLKESM